MLTRLTLLLAGIGAGSNMARAQSPPTIITQPVDQAVHIGQSASFTVAVAAADSPAQYHWRKDGVNVANATNAAYQFLVTQTNQAGTYDVVTSNSAGDTPSAPASLTVDATTVGSVVTWGDTAYGPVPMELQSGATGIALGGYATLKNGSVIPYPFATPVPPAAQSGVKAVASFNHFLALKTDGSVVAWGYAAHGETIVPGVAQSGVKAVAAGGAFSVALREDGSVVAWGENDHGETTIPAAAQSNVTAIAAGYKHVLALKSDGGVVAWGFNESGQATVPVEAQSGVKAVAGGAWFSLALKEDGSVIKWGVDGPELNVPAAAKSDVTAIAAGWSHALALKKDGSVVAWGSDTYGRMPAIVPAGLSDVTAIGAAFGLSVAIVGSAPAATVPRLDVRSGENELILSWPTNVAGFRLQSTYDLITWTDVTNPPAIDGPVSTVTNDASGTARFYRLRQL